MTPHLVEAPRQGIGPVGSSVVTVWLIGKHGGGWSMVQSGRVARLREAARSPAAVASIVKSSHSVGRR